MIAISLSLCYNKAMRKGQKMSQEQREKLSKAHKGKVFSAEHLKNLSESHKGQIPTNLEQLRQLAKRPKSQEHIEKIKLSNLGKKHNWTLKGKKDFSESKLGQSSWNKGLKGYMGSDKNWRWISDRTKLKKSEDRRNSANNYWVKQCKERDGYKCKMRNKDCCGRLEVHHIERWIDKPELRYDTNNGITLCHFHHPRKRKDEEQLIEIFKKLIVS